MDFHTIKPEHRPKLRALNDRLYELQDKVVAEMVALDKQLYARVKDDNDIRWAELVRISRIVVEPKVQYQFFSELTN